MFNIPQEYREYLHNNYLMKDNLSITRILLRVSAFKRAIKLRNPSNIHEDKAEGLLHCSLAVKRSPLQEVQTRQARIEHTQLRRRQELVWKSH